MANKKRKKPYIVRLMRKIKKTFRMWKRKNPLKAYRLHIITTVCIIAIVAFATFKTGLAHDFVRHFSESEEASVTEAPADTMTPQPTEEVVQTAAPAPVQTKVPAKKNTVDTRYLYSYFQGPKAKTMKKNLAVIFGGRSSEHEVSCVSVVTIAKAVDLEKYNMFLIGITKDGDWKLVEDIAGIEDGSWKESPVSAIISPDTKGGLIISQDDMMKVQPIDVIFPVLHGMYGEDGTIQ